MPDSNRMSKIHGIKKIMRDFLTEKILHKNRQGLSLSLMFENIDVYSLSLSLKGIV